jgi:hypothetical protein
MRDEIKLDGYGAIRQIAERGKEQTLDLFYDHFFAGDNLEKYCWSWRWTSMNTSKSIPDLGTRQKLE